MSTGIQDGIIRQRSRFESMSVHLLQQSPDDGNLVGIIGFANHGKGRVVIAFVGSSQETLLDLQQLLHLVGHDSRLLPMPIGKNDVTKGDEIGLDFRPVLSGLLNHFVEHGFGLGSMIFRCGGGIGGCLTQGGNQFIVGQCGGHQVHRCRDTGQHLLRVDQFMNLVQIVRSGSLTEGSQNPNKGLGIRHEWMTLNFLHNVVVVVVIIIKEFAVLTKGCLELFIGHIGYIQERIQIIVDVTHLFNVFGRVHFIEIILFFLLTHNVINGVNHDT
mmetsp:Transcript_13023/g.30287  ORF Transcript_13023/g.30287 Transcript_13023/m.30287 type:complete len:272 (+) Transcript_13023:567-1382(+)